MTEGPSLRLVLGTTLAVYALTVLIGLSFILTGCATITGTPPVATQRAVYAVKADYRAALAGAVAYRRLPSCPQPTAICADPSVVVMLRTANHSALSAIDGAERAVRSPSNASAATSAVQSARDAVASFTALVAGLRR